MDMGDIASKMNDPAFMESAMSMMKDMDEASIANMMMSSGMCKSQEQAESMAKQVSCKLVPPCVLMCSGSLAELLSALTQVIYHI
jgi:hypothetical protein